MILNDAIKQFTSINDWSRRMFRMFRNTLKYGDSFFIRDPETQELIHVAATKCEKIIVNESKGKRPEQYVFKDLNLNLESLSASQVAANITYSSPGASHATDQGYGKSGGAYSGPGTYGTGGAGRFESTQNQYAIDASHVAHMSMSEGLDSNFPFGTSILETVFKTFKQKEMLEDAIIIYRVHRAPERRVFYIDVGNMPRGKSEEYMKSIMTKYRNKLVYDAATGQIKDDRKHMSMLEDFWLPRREGGKGLSLIHI